MKKNAVISLIVIIIMVGLWFFIKSLYSTVSDSEQITRINSQITTLEIKIREKRLLKQTITDQLNSLDKEITRVSSQKTVLESKKTSILYSWLDYMQPKQIETPVVIDTGIEKSASKLLDEAFPQVQ